MTCGVGYECVPCGEHFRSLALFDTHQSYRGNSIFPRCLTPEQMEKKGWLRDGAGCWTETEGAGRGGNRRETPTDCSVSDEGAA